MRHFTPLLAAAASILITAPASADLGDQLAKLLPDDGAAGDQFGRSVAIDGTTAIVGAKFDVDNGIESGSAYLFDVTTGEQIAKLLPDDGAAGDWFGNSVAISGTTAIVGALWDDDNGNGSGSAYLFDTTTGQQTAKLLPDDGAYRDHFGNSVAISGTTAIVGAFADDDNGAGSGSAYLFDTTTGKQIAKLLPDDGAIQDKFGSVAISGATAIVGAPWDDDNGTQSGSAYLFDTTTGKQIAKLLASDGAEGHIFGTSVGISGTTAIVGASWVYTNNGVDSGSAYLFDTTTGKQIARLLASDGAKWDLFGCDVAIRGVTVLVGARWDDDNGSASGSAYLFDISDPADPTQIAKLLASDAAESDIFGNSVGISGPTGSEIAIIGAYGDDDHGSASGAAYLFVAGALAGTPTTLASCAITFGTTDNPPCDVANLIDDDDVDQILRSQFGFAAFERNLTEIAIEGNGADATTMVAIHTHDGGDTTNVVAKLKARNYTTNTIDDIAQYNISFPTDDTSHTTPVGSADYVAANGDVEVRLRYVAPATFTPLGFTVGLDQLEVMVE